MKNYHKLNYKFINIYSKKFAVDRCRYPVNQKIYRA